MKYAFSFGLISVALALASSLYPSVSLILLWTALSFVVVAVGYAGFGSHVFGKRPDGSIPWFTKLVLLPYLLYTWTVWHIYRLLSREASYNRIGDDLFVGRRLLASELFQRFDHYVDLTAEFEEPRSIRAEPGYCCFPILDADIPSASELDRFAQETKIGKTYVHCAQGHGRTGLFALALLFQRRQITTAEEGLLLLQSLRPAISLNRKQTIFIEAYLNEKAEPGGPANAAKLHR